MSSSIESSHTQQSSISAGSISLLKSAKNTKENSPYLPYRNILLAPHRVKELSQLRAHVAVLDTAVCWGSILCALMLCALIPTWWMVLIAIPLIGTRYYGLFIIAHDGFHRRIFKNSNWNDLFADLLLCAPVGAITRINKRNHLGHHSHFASEVDPDRYKYRCFGKTTVIELFSALSGVGSVIRNLSNVYLRRAKTENVLEGADPAESEGYKARDLAILAFDQILIIGGLSYFIGWWAYPVLWLFPVYIFAYLGDTVRSFCEHSHPQHDTAADEHRLITYVSGPIERLFFSPMNMNLHTTHHLWPSIPYYNLPQADKEVRAACDLLRIGADKLEWRKSYIGYLLTYIRKLPLVECRGTQAEAALLKAGTGQI